MALSLESLPLGCRFHPEDEELVDHYLTRKINGSLPEKDDVIEEVDVFKFEPHDLPDKSWIKSDASKWFFFSPVDRKYPNGRRSNRATKYGFWKSTGRDREIMRLGKLIGMRKTLVFHQRRSPDGERTNWSIYEYRVTPSGVDDGQGGFVLCLLFRKKSGKSPNSHEEEPSSISPTMNRSSPEGRQLANDVVEHSEPVQNVVIHNPDMPQPVSMAIETQPLADEADSGTSSYPPQREEIICNSNTASPVEDREAGVPPVEWDPIEIAFEHIYEPSFDVCQDTLAHSQLNPEMHRELGLLSADLSLNGQDAEPSCRDEQNASCDSFNELLKNIIADFDESLANNLIAQNASSERGFGVEISDGDLLQSELERIIQFQPEGIGESISGFASVSSSHADAKVTAPLPSQWVPIEKAFEHIYEPSFDECQDTLAHSQLNGQDMEQSCRVRQNASFDSFNELLKNHIVDNDESLANNLTAQNASPERGFGVEISDGYLLQSEMERMIQFQPEGIGESISGFASVSSSHADAKVTAPLPSQVDDSWREASVRASWPGFSFVDAENYVQMHCMQGSSKTEPIVGRPLTPHESPVWNVSSGDLCAESSHGVMSQELINGKSLGGGTDNGTGIEIRDHQPQYAANANRLVAQGFASRRIRLQIVPGLFSMANESASEMGHNEDDASVSTDENVENTDVNGSEVSVCHNLEKIQHFSPVDDCKGEETPNSAALYPAEEFQNKEQLLDSDSSRKASHVSIVKRRLRPNQKDGRDGILKGWSLQLETAKTSFVSVYVAFMAIFIISLCLLRYGEVYSL